MVSTSTFQIPLDSAPDENWDVLVAGAGPAGSIAAYHLSTMGHRVLLAERKSFPRDKACGDLLIKDSIDCLRRAGIYDRVRAHAQPTDTALVSSPSMIEWTVDGEFMVVARRDLDCLVAERASEAGAVVVKAKVDALDVQDDGSVIGTLSRPDRVVRARTAIIATGADTQLADRLGMVVRRQPTAVALRQYVRSDASLTPLVFSFVRDIVPGYGWIFPLADGWYNVGCGAVCNGGSTPSVDLHRTLATFYEAYPAAGAIRSAAVESRPVRGARLRAGLDGVRFVGPGHVLAVGETVGTTYPLTGEGIGKAMESGELAARALHAALEEGDQGAFAGYGHHMEELRPRYEGYETAQRWLSRPFLNDLIARRAKRSRYLRETATALVNETENPRALFSVRGLVKSLWR